MKARPYPTPQRRRFAACGLLLMTALALAGRVQAGTLCEVNFNFTVQNRTLYFYNVPENRERLTFIESVKWDTDVWVSDPVPYMPWNASGEVATRAGDTVPGFNLRGCSLTVRFAVRGFGEVQLTTKRDFPSFDIQRYCMLIPSDGRPPIDGFQAGTCVYRSATTGMYARGEHVDIKMEQLER